MAEDLGMHSCRGNNNSRKKDGITEPVILDSRDLFGKSTEIKIRHQDELYRLLITRNDKLILNK